jgi:hypothetical protein
MGTIVGMLDPWPSNVLPTDSCTAPIITFDTAFSVISGELHASTTIRSFYAFCYSVHARELRM